MAEANLKEKILVLIVMEWRATTAEKRLELAEQKANEAASKLSENELKLTKTTSALSARDKNFFELQSGEKAQ